MTDDWVSHSSQAFSRGGCAADIRPPSTAFWRGSDKNKGPVLRTEEGQEGAILCNDDESLSCASRENSLADCGLFKQNSFEAVQSNMGDFEICSNGAAEISAQSATPAVSPSHANQSEASSSPEQAASNTEEEAAGRESCSTDDDQFSDVGEAADTEVVYVREGVAVWPTKHQRIMGRLSLIKQHQVMFLAWLPYSQGSLNRDGTFYSSATAEKSAVQSAKDRTMYAVHPIPLSEVKAIRKHTPAFGWQYIVLVLVNGLTLPPLYFGTGGVRALFATLKQHIYLVKGADDPNTYLVNDTADPLQRSLTCLELTDVLMGAPPPGASTTWPPPAGGVWVGPEVGSTVQWQEGTDARAPLVASVLEQFGRMTALARETTTSLLTSTAYWGAQPDDDALDAAAAACGPAAAVQPLVAGALPPPLLMARQAARGLDPSQEEQHDRLHSGELTSTSVGIFELIDKSGARLPMDRRPSSPAPPVYLEEFESFFNSEGRLVRWKAFKERVFSSGIEASLRQLAWKFLLGVFPPDSTRIEREAFLKDKNREYEILRSQWQTMNEEQASRNAKWRERRSRVDKDVHRTDRQQPFYSESRSSNIKQLRNILLTYVQYNNDLGYCQGMSDLASPILYVMRNEAEAFWCFTALMRRLEGNFLTDSMAMHGQLLALRKLVQLLDPPMHAFMESKSCLNYFFCYRWLLIHFKREFSFDEVLRFWEALWANPHHEHFHLFVCVAVLEHHRRAIMNSCQDFDDLLKFCVELSGRIPMTTVLQDADALCKWAGDAGMDCVAELNPAQL